MNALFTHFAAACPTPQFLAFNHSWYSYLPSTSINGVCTPQINGINDIWLIVAAVIEILLQIAALGAVIFVIYGGVEFMTSQGEPDKTNRARTTILNAIIGLIIAISSATIINFIATQIT